jgi:hypothetical protein
LVERNKNNMKHLALIFLIFLSVSFANATEYKLTKPAVKTSSLNECLYAFTKGTKLSSSLGDTFIYKKELWRVFYHEGDELISCELVGVFGE